MMEKLNNISSLRASGKRMRSDRKYHSWTLNAAYLEKYVCGINLENGDRIRADMSGTSILIQLQAEISAKPTFRVLDRKF